MTFIQKDSTEVCCTVKPFSIVQTLALVCTKMELPSGKSGKSGKSDNDIDGFDTIEVVNPMSEPSVSEEATQTTHQKDIFTKPSDIEKVGVCVFNLCTITKHSPPIFNTLSTFAVCFTSYLAFQYCSLRYRNGRIVPTLVWVVRNWNHLCQLIVVIILTECLRSGNDEIRDDYQAADGHTVHRYYHCTDLYYGLNYLKSAYHFVLICYVIVGGEITIYNFFAYTGKYFFKTFYINWCRKAAVSAAVGREAVAEA